MDAESKERGRDYLAADIFLTAARLAVRRAQADADTPIAEERLEAPTGRPQRGDLRILSSLAGHETRLNQAQRFP